MRALAIVHQPDAGPGVFEDAVRDAGERLDTWLFPSEEPPADPRSYDAVLTFGGAMHADQDAAHPWIRRERALLAELLERDVPILGVCLGAQLLAQAAGALVRRAARPEIGWHQVKVTDEGGRDPLLGPLAPRFDALQWHSYEALLPDGATTLAQSEICLQAYRIGSRAWGIQFHAEVTAEQFDAWVDDYRSDEDAVRMGLDPADLRHRSQAAMPAWSQLGRGLCERFVAAAAA